MEKPTDQDSGASVRPVRASKAPARTWDRGFFLAAPFLLSDEEMLAAIHNSKWRHYIYGLCLDNGAVFYVGKGVNTRAMEHAKQASNGDESEKSIYIRHIGQRMRYTLFAFCEDEPYALAHEACLIRRHHDVLSNVAVPSYDYIAKLLDRDPEKELLIKLVIDLCNIGDMISEGENQSRMDMIKIIEECPEVIRTLTNEELEWTFQRDDGKTIRAVVEKKILEAEHGRS